MTSSYETRCCYQIEIASFSSFATAAYLVASVISFTVGFTATNIVKAESSRMGVVGLFGSSQM